MEKLSQESAPIYEALEKFRKMRVVPFDVPGHKRGRGNPELERLLGDRCMNLDVNSMKPLDNLCHPVSVIRQAEELAAEAFQCGPRFFDGRGTTSSVQSMILSVAKRGEKIYSSEECAPKRAYGNGTVRSSACVCKSTV